MQKRIDYKAKVTATATNPKLVSISRQELSTHIINIIFLRESLDDDIRFLFVDALPISRYNRIINMMTKYSFNAAPQCNFELKRQIQVCPDICLTEKAYKTKLLILQIIEDIFPDKLKKEYHIHKITIEPLLLRKLEK